MGPPIPALSEPPGADPGDPGLWLARGMRLHLLYFAVLRERAGAPEEWLEVPTEATPASVYAGRFPQLALRVGYARNGRICPADTPLFEGDELALLPPVGGG